MLVRRSMGRATNWLWDSINLVEKRADETPGRVHLLLGSFASSSVTSPTHPGTPGHRRNGRDEFTTTWLRGRAATRGAMERCRFLLTTGTAWRPLRKHAANSCPTRSSRPPLVDQEAISRQRDRIKARKALADVPLRRESNYSKELIVPPFFTATWGDRRRHPYQHELQLATP